QFGMLSLLVLLPLQLLSGGQTPRESMPEFVQKIMLAAPSTHFVAAGQGILFRGAGSEDVWINFLAMAVIAAVFFMIALNRFRKTISLMA
ncbi:MAG: ABC transporter permease, partial [Christensenella sp.]|uniref:ABC transporter permease n=1 Tax=Christensenella sp. TaxID=1935934 RepID=UPI002B1FE24F